MAQYNAPLTLDGQPCVSPGELLVDQQPFVNFEVESGGGYPGLGGSFVGNGVAYLTTKRLVFVANGAHGGMDIPGLMSYGISYSIIHGEELKEPFFGSPRIVAKMISSGDMSRMRSVVGEFKLTFKKGGESPFFRKFHTLLEQTRTGSLSPHNEFSQKESDGKQNQYQSQPPLSPASQYSAGPLFQSGTYVSAYTTSPQLGSFPTSTVPYGSAPPMYVGQPVMLGQPLRPNSQLEPTPCGDSSMYPPVQTLGYPQQQQQQQYQQQQPFSAGPPLPSYSATTSSSTTASYPCGNYVQATSTCPTQWLAQHCSNSAGSRRDVSQLVAHPQQLQLEPQQPYMYQQQDSMKSEARLPSLVVSEKKE